MISPPIQSAMFFDDRMHSFVTKSVKRLVGMLFTNRTKRSAKSMDKGVGKCGRLSCRCRWERPFQLLATYLES